MKRIVAGILAHVDSGKTTLSEAMLYHTGTIRKPGRVDHRNTYLDTDRIERERGITIFSKQAIIKLDNAEITLLDTPGHADFQRKPKEFSRYLIVRYLSSAARTVFRVILKPYGAFLHVIAYLYLFL